MADSKSSARTKRCLYLMTIGLAGFSAHVQGSSGNEVRQTGYFISIDGLQTPLLESFVRSNDASDGGFKSFWKSGAVFPKTSAHMISITAASHASTATCVSPAKHGIIGNHFLKDHRRVSGFQLPYQSKTMWEVAREQGKKVVSYAYAGVDGSTPARTVDAGITYPDESKMGSPQVLELEGQATKSVVIDVPLLDGQTRQLHLKIIPKLDGAKLPHSKSPANSKIIWKDVHNIEHQTQFVKNLAGMYVADLVFSDSQRMRRILVFELDSERGRYLISRVSYNAAFPENFRAALDKANQVWPDVNIKKMTLEISPLETVALLSTLDDFIAAAALATLPKLKPDIVLLYQPLIDSIGHAFQNALPDTRSLARRDPVTRAFREAFTQVDTNLSRLISDTRKQDIVAVMGDHGMTKTLVNVNIAPLISEAADQNFHVYGSDAMLFLYPKPDVQDPEVINRLGKEVKRSLEKLRWHGKKVLETSMEKFKDADSENRWIYGDAAWAFRTTPGFWLNNNSLNRDIFTPAKVPGMHGHNPSHATMLTTLMIKGKGAKRGVFRNVSASLSQAVPTFATLLKVRPPEGCEGKPLF